MQNNLQMNWFFRGRGGRKTKEGEEKEECRWGFCGGNFLRAFVRGGSILVTTRGGQSMPGRRAYRDTALHSSASRSFEDNLTPTSSRGNYTTPPLSVILAANRDARRTMISKPFADTALAREEGSLGQPNLTLQTGLERGRGEFSPLFCRVRHLQPSPPRSFVCSFLAEIAK